MNATINLTAISIERGGKRVVDGIDLTISTGTWFGVIGANGSGKTSLLRALGGRLTFTEGRCLIAGVDMTDDRCGRAERFGFAPPGESLPGDLRVREILELVGGDIAIVRDRVGPVWQALGLDGLLQQWIGNCSAGMRQRVALTLAFAAGHTLVILDEPFNWLDPVATFDLRQSLRAMVDDGLTLVTALHDLGTLAVSCDTGVMLADGRVAMALARSDLQQAACDPRAFERITIDLLRSGDSKYN